MAYSSATDEAPPEDQGRVDPEPIALATAADFALLVELAAETCQASGALICATSGEEQVCRAAVTAQTGLLESIEMLCREVAGAGLPLIIDEDAVAGPAVDFAESLDASIRFFAGIPLRSACGNVLGALCVFDEQPRNLSAQQLQRLDGLARQAVALIELERDEVELQRVRRRLGHDEKLARVAGWEWDARSDEASWSAELRTLLGVDEAFEGTLQNFAALIHPDDRETVMSTVGAAFEAGDSFSYRARFVRLDGQERTFDTRGETLLDADGQPCGLVGATADVTELVEAERRSRERADALRAAFETALDPFTIIDDRRRVLEVNRATSALLGYDRSELLEMRIEELVLGMDSETIGSMWQEFIHSGDRRGELRLRRRDGTEVLVEFSATANFVQDQHLVMFRDVTERRRAEADALEARVRLEETQALAQVGSWEWNLSVDLQIFSDELLRILGRPDGAAPPNYQEFLSYIHPEDLASYMEIAETCIRTGEPFGQSFRVITESGDVRTIESHGQLQVNAKGEPVRMFGAAQDVTDRERAAANMRLQAEVLDQLPVAVIATDSDGAITLWNRAAEDSFALVREQAIGRRFDDLELVPPQSESLRAKMRERLSQARAWEGEIHLQDTAGRGFPALVTNSPQENSRGELVGFVGVIVDMTEQRTIESELRDQSQILNHIQSAVITLDLDRRVTRWSPGAERLYGWTAEEVLGRHAEELALTGSRSGITRKHVQDAVLADGHWEGEIEVRRKDGTTFPVLSTNSAILDNEGNPVGLIGVSLDLSEQKQAEEEVRQARLETIVKLARAVEKRDPETGGHSERIGALAALLAERSGIDEETVELIRISSPMHDVGKIGIPDAILLKPGLLTAQERIEMERHTTIGHEILSDSHSAVLDMAARIALSHHERIDGGGYPFGLAGKEIPVEARIVAVADVFDALTSDRVYRPAFATEKAIEIMRAERGTHFDVEILDLLLADVPAFAELVSHHE